MHPTSEGKRFLLAAFLVAAAALNSGNNLIYLVLAMMLSILVISYLVPLVNLSGLSLTIHVHQPIFVRQRAYMEIRIRNTKRHFSSYSLRIRLGGALEGEAVTTHIAAESMAYLETSVYFKKRGVYRYGDLLIESGFPFIFFRRAIRASLEGEVTVYPEMIHVQELDVLNADEKDAVFTERPGKGDELLTIREFKEGDDIGDIHWKASAKTERLMVKELSEEEPRAVTVILDDQLPYRPDAFERAVSYAASYAMMFTDRGFYVSLITCGKILPLRGGSDHLYKILDILAEVKEENGACPEIEDIQGMGLLILKSEGSNLKGLTPFCDKVIYV